MLNWRIIHVVLCLSIVLFTYAPYKALAITWAYHPVGTLKSPWHGIGQHTWQTEDDKTHLSLQLHVYPDNDMAMFVFIPRDYQPQPHENSDLIFYDLERFPGHPVQDFAMHYLGESDSLQNKNLHWLVFATERKDRRHLEEIVRKGTSLAWILFNNNNVFRLYDPSSTVPQPVRTKTDPACRCP